MECANLCIYVYVRFEYSLANISLSGGEAGWGVETPGQLSSPRFLGWSIHPFIAKLVDSPIITWGQMQL